MTNNGTNEPVDLQAEETPRAARNTPPRPTKSPQATMLTLAGLATTVFGLALSILPLFSWKAHKVMNGLDVLGVHGGALAIGGMVLFALGMVRRGQVVASASLSESNVDSEIVEEMAADVVQMRNAVDHMQLVVSGLQTELANVKNEIVAAMPEPVAPVVNEVPAGNGSEDAIFRLAASLDKVGAKIEERLKSQFADFQERIASVEANVRDSVGALQAQTPAPVAEPVAAVEPTVEQPVVPPVPEAPAAEVQPEAQPQLELQAEPQPAPESPLGVLDTLDDEVTGALPTEPAIDFDHIETVQLDESDAALPKGPGAGVWEEELEMVETGDEAADERLRAALEDMKRQGEQPDGGPGLGA